MEMIRLSNCLKPFFGLLVSFAFLLIVGCESLETWKKDFSRAIGLEKAELIEEDIVIAPPLVLPPDYELMAPESGKAPEAYAKDFPDQDLTDESLGDSADIIDRVTTSDDGTNRDRRDLRYQNYSEDGKHPSPPKNINYGQVDSIYKNAIRDYKSTNYDPNYSRQYYSRKYPDTLVGDNQTYSSQNSPTQQTQTHDDLARYKEDTKAIGEIEGGVLEEAQTCEKITKGSGGEYVCID